VNKNINYFYQPHKKKNLSLSIQRTSQNETEQHEILPLCDECEYKRQQVGDGNGRWIWKLNKTRKYS